MCVCVYMYVCIYTNKVLCYTDLYIDTYLFRTHEQCNITATHRRRIGLTWKIKHTTLVLDIFNLIAPESVITSEMS